MKEFTHEPLKMNLQLFAEGGDDNTNPDGKNNTTDDNNNNDNNNNDDSKTYTEEQVQQMIKDRLKREKKDMPSKEDLEAFKEWKESQKTPDDKTKEEAEALEQIKKEAEEYKQKAQMYENKEKVLKKDVPLEFAEFVAYQANKLVDEDVTFDKALEKYLKDNPQYTEDTTKPLRTGMKQNRATGQSDPVAEAFFKRNPHLKPKQ